ncbi:hypothetical protein [Gorillibacterium massiliense]|uniref:hypothetical protein n=1 Tax=Gorillibacterium massiliense TaxID=1280390 RepID=UPI0012DEE5DF|nr:hypothetical protein [Gorillibacterium massiliense]
MRKIFFVSLFSVLILTTACGSSGSSSNGGNKESSAPVENRVTLSINEKNYTFPSRSESTNRYVKAVPTADGIVWSPAPEMENTSSIADIRPVEPFEIYYSHASDLKIDKINSRKIYTLPLQKDGAEVFLENLYSVHQYILFTTYTKKPGMVQAIENQLFYITPDDAEAKLITSFHESGGYLFDFNINDQNTVKYTQSSPNADGGYDEASFVFHLDTGINEPISAADIHK